MYSLLPEKPEAPPLELPWPLAGWRANTAKAENKLHWTGCHWWVCLFLAIRTSNTSGCESTGSQGNQGETACMGQIVTGAHACFWTSDPKNCESTGSKGRQGGYCMHGTSCHRHAFLLSAIRPSKYCRKVLKDTSSIRTYDVIAWCMHDKIQRHN